MTDRNNPNYPGKRGPHLDDDGEPIPNHVLAEAHEEYRQLCAALEVFATVLYVEFGPVKDPAWLAEGIIERYMETDFSFLDVLKREDIVEAAGLAVWQTDAGKVFAKKFNELSKD